jgi:two-component system chemotaxis response regulator CheY
MTALVIEDDKPLRWILEKILKDNFEVISKPDGFNGLGWLAQGNIPNLIITDFHLPKMNGLKFINSLKKSGVYKKIPIIVISGEEDPILASACIDAGADGFLNKPFDPTELKNLIHELVMKNSMTY